MGYIPRQTYNEAAGELEALLDAEGFESELGNKIRHTVFDHIFKFLRMILKERSASSGLTVTDQIVIDGLEPSDLMLRLLAAVRANDCDEINTVIHEASLPVSC